MTTTNALRPNFILFEIAHRDLSFAHGETLLKLVASTSHAENLRTEELVASIRDKQVVLAYSPAFRKKLKLIGCTKEDLQPLEVHLTRELQLCISVPDRVVNRYIKQPQPTFRINFQNAAL